MTDTVKKATNGTSGATGTMSDLANSEAADRLKSEFQAYLAAQAQRAMGGLGHKLGETTGKLTNIAEGKSPGLGKVAVDGGRKLAEGKGPVRSALGAAAGNAKDKVVGAFKSLGGKGKKKSAGKAPTVILEYVDVSVDVRTAYDQWTQFEEFSSFAKGVTSANRADDTTSEWQLKILWSNRSWKGQTRDQMPDDRIAWSSEGAKGTTKGVVSFHEVADHLTRIVLVMEYYPVGLFEKTGNIWRAQGRRARLDLKNFARFITLRGEASDNAWRGEIRDGEVVQSHEDAVAEEEQEESKAEEPEEERAEDAAEGDEEPGEDEDEEDEEGEDEEEGYEDDSENAGGAAEDEDEAYPEDEEAADEDEEPRADKSQRAKRRSRR
ncbi:SRPBCC family protein [Streptomyces cadmiisoli]|uniref:SRPBCC family protein n=1 Tax=Streptomyces cadmiisoli TaxID=2184053 RepID=UPI003D718A77